MTVYSREECHLCDQAIESIKRVEEKLDADIDLHIIDVDDNPRLRRDYGDRLPVVFVDGDLLFEYRVDEFGFQNRIRELQ